jgi:hypothetical protein
MVRFATQYQRIARIRIPRMTFVGKMGYSLLHLLIALLL